MPYPEISGAMVRNKTTFIEKTGVDVVVATDAGCLMNIGGRLHGQGGRAGQCTSRKCWRGRRERRPHMDEYGTTWMRNARPTTHRKTRTRRGRCAASCGCSRRLPRPAWR